MALCDAPSKTPHKRLYQPCRFRVAMAAKDGGGHGHWRWVNGYTAKVENPSVAVYMVGGRWIFTHVRTGLQLPHLYGRALGKIAPLLDRLNRSAALDCPDVEAPGDLPDNRPAMLQDILSALKDIGYAGLEARPLANLMARAA